MNETEVDENLIAAKEESSDESTVISSQTSTLTRNQGEETLSINELNFRLIFRKMSTGHDEMQQAVLAMSLQEHLSLCSDDEESDDEEGNDEACGVTLEEAYDDGKSQIDDFKAQFNHQPTFIQTQQLKC